MIAVIVRIARIVRIVEDSMIVKIAATGGTVPT